MRSPLKQVPGFPCLTDGFLLIFNVSPMNLTGRDVGTCL